MEVIISKEMVNKIDKTVNKNIKVENMTNFCFPEGTVFKFNTGGELDSVYIKVKTVRYDLKKLTVGVSVEDKFLTNIIIIDQTVKMSHPMNSDIHTLMKYVTTILYHINSQALQDKEKCDKAQNRNRNYGININQSKTLTNVSVRKLEGEAATYEQSESKSDIDRNYHVESWGRRGFYRNYKSGKRVFIRPVTCNRKRELSDNKIDRREEIYI